ncbi:YfbM family protein [Nocardia cyriacigeorgica]|uniref:DUF1877 family protein n=1 Tax=Nocardia cyriacigeorgica (strain GUH-2) TaxID=1127134 RepID=H6RB06_NOCCG|nr:YfbM family protein [Nocardia cyriacigeorgica]MBF6085058.1 YfbM family protein [Nocardia cyriacigeorgica]CCF61245.1 protein of unknown function [Nocardia cyriacigeorgica GUH-2]
MGMIASFTRLSPAELTQLRQAATADDKFDYLSDLPRAGEPSGYIDKSWAALQFLLLQACSDVDLLYRDDVLDSTDGLYAWSAERVASTARGLRETSFSTLAERFDPALMDGTGIYPSGMWSTDPDALDYLRHHYTNLVEFFRHAESTGSAAALRLG